ncbi:hypothetical protein C1645_831888 [Glomus cerebriforme]|uniref:DNA topoisomerase (ATP-hydrolyzing) n=1 Tax=Glomus cerebriforme TaxID=658196 RepID=A0A397SPX6_9GLOM|nr:hypothetical protein C1645_831888 [Glomus cerebriforme]
MYTGIYEIVDEISVNAVDNKEQTILVPKFIFGHLLTTSNYDDSEKKVTGGRNDYGANLANIFRLCVNDIKVFSNIERLKLITFKEYMQLHLGERDKPQTSIVYEHVNERWEIGALPSPEFNSNNGLGTSSSNEAKKY